MASTHSTWLRVRPATHGTKGQMTERQKGRPRLATFLAGGTVPGAEERLRPMLLCSEGPGGWGQRSPPAAPAKGQCGCFSGSFLDAFLFEGCDAGYLLDISWTRGQAAAPGL